jgi:hypothetical protein
MLSGNAGGSKTAAFDTQVTTLQTAIGAKRSELAACNPVMLTKCVNPRTAELTAKQAELDSLLAKGNDLVEERTRAESWQRLANTFGTTVAGIQFGYCRITRSFA